MTHLLTVHTRYFGLPALVQTPRVLILCHYLHVNSDISKIISYFSAVTTLNVYIMSCSVVVKHVLYQLFSTEATPLEFPQIAAFAPTESSRTEVYIQAAFSFPSADSLSYVWTLTFQDNTVHCAQ